MEKESLYYQLILIAEEKSTILDTVEYDPEVARENPHYTELEARERELLLQIKKIEDEEIIENSYIFAYDFGLAAKKAALENANNDSIEE